MSDVRDKQPDRKTVQDLYVRICRDSGFKIGWVEAAHLTGKVLGMSALEVWLSMPGMDIMERIAKGSHPAAHK